MEGNFYWVPGTDRAPVTVLHYADHVKIYRARLCLIEYRLPPDGVRQARFHPEGHV